MKFIFNGNFFDEADALFGKINRAFQLGDFISETVKIADGNLLLWEEHYFNLMASMRIFRMNIPLNFTQEFFEEEINKLARENKISNAKVQISIYRNADSNDLLTKSTVSYLIEILEEFSSEKYSWKKDVSEIEIFKDYTVNPTFFTQVNSHKPEEIIARAFMQENEYDDLVLLNPEKKIARTLLGNPFLIQGNHIKTPEISEGGIRSVTRNHLCNLIAKSEDFTLEETDIFPFELQKTDEVFICLESEGILSIHQNRKKNYTTEKTKEIFALLNSEL
ncbi:aminotransferase class IV [Moheibacter lacus]|uniref:Aminotransferase class IV n=1 Tax=Moheibacter lacus TaxID=2745851 RepID=A0A838ZPX3_9FLAO|nr:aminotransferase class IV [Moheibacter lacus]MBA5629647.1 aminotransferase class IV [Moheibacter lacus]